MTRRGSDHELEYRLIDAQGRARWVRDLVTVVVSDGEPALLRGVMVDITALKAVEQALRRSEENFRTLIENSPQLIGVIHQGLLLYVNPALVAALGYSGAEELVGKPVLDLVPLEEHGVARGREQEALAGHIGRSERHIRRKDGALITTETVNVPMLFDGLPSVVTIARDVSEERRLQERVSLSARMASIGTLAAGVAHEINNPLAYVATNLEFVREQLESGPPAPAALHEIGRAIDESRQGVERIRVIVRDLRAFSRPDETLVGATDVRGVLDTAIAMAQNEIRHRARITRSYNDVPDVRGSAARLGQVFLNLVVNAAHAIPDGAAERNEIRLATSLAADGRVCVEVSDTGAGIAPEHLGHLFDPFFTTKPVGVGTGLGLFIVHGIISSLGGEISVRSRVGEGTSFRVLLPVGVRDPLAPSVGTPEPVVFARRLKVFAIDDEPLVLRAIRRSLAALDVTPFLEAGAMLQALAEGKTCDVVLCDLMMPTMTGSELFEALEKSYPDVAPRVIFLTGGAFTTEARQFLARVTNVRVEKPFTREQLLSAIAQMLGGNRSVP